MDPNRWQQLRPLFDRAVDLDDEARSVFLAEISARDSALHDELVALIRGQQHLKDEISLSAIDLVMPSMRETVEEDASLDEKYVGECIGPYRLMRLLGAGGMGAVYLAERSDRKFEHRVALKIVRGAFASTSARERFERERSVLAGLHHAGIAQLFDGGETPEGQAFYTMEFVEGVPVTEYCNALNSVASQLRILLQVASALAHAHQNLVVHRDIKPTNVLVDTDGVAKLVDFGLAKSLQSNPDGTLTVAGAGPLTPAYAAPEQFRNAPVTVATDIYQFGVLCYFVLARRLPYRADPNDAFEWARAVSTEEPLILAEARRLFERSGSEHASPAAGRKLSGDLDAIVRKALAKNPAQRYRSVDAMTADIEAYLDGRPVTARRATAAYFVGRFLQRWRYAVAATALAFVALTASTIFALHQAKVARAEADHANSVAGFLVSLFRVSDPGVNRGERLNANEILDQGAQRLARELADQPAERARLLSTIGEVYMELGDFTRARQPLEQATSLMRSGQSDPLDFAHALNTLAAVASRQNDFDGVLALLDEAEPLIPDTGQRALEERAMLHSRRAFQFHASSRLAEAQNEFRRALEISESAGNARTLMTARIHNSYGSLLQDLGDKTGARNEYESARSISLENGNEFLAVVPSTNLATVLIDLGELDQARDLLLKNQERLREFFGDNVDVATSEFYLGDIARKKGEFDEALVRLARAEAMLRSTLGERHPEVAWATVSYAQALIGKGEIHAGVQKLEEALALRRQLLGPAALDVAESLDGTVIPLLRVGRASEADANAEEALAIWRVKLPPNHASLVRGLLHAGLAHFARGDTAAAQAAWDEALARAPSYSAASPVMQALSTAMLNPAAALLGL